MKKTISLLILCGVMLVVMGCTGQVKQKDITDIGKQTEVANGSNYKIIKQNYTDRKVTINYPQVTEMNDSKRQEKINEIIKTEALHILGWYSDAQLDKFSMELEYEIKWQNAEILSIKYSGLRYLKDTAHPTYVFFTTNINMHEGSRLRLKELVNIDVDFVEKLRNGKFIAEASPQITIKMLNFTNDRLVDGLNTADWLGYPANRYGTYSYFTGDSLGVSIEAGHAYGDHVEFEVKYQDIANNIKTGNEAWKSFRQEFQDRRDK